MRLKSAHVRNYRSVIDTGVFDIETDKTIFVGPNEAGKSAILQALQHINAPKGTRPLDPLRDYPRRLYSDLRRGEVSAADVPVATVVFSLDDEDNSEIPEDWEDITYTFTRNLDGGFSHSLIGAPDRVAAGSMREQLLKLAGHLDVQWNASEDDEGEKPSETIASIFPDTKFDQNVLSHETANKLIECLDNNLKFLDQSNKEYDQFYDDLYAKINIGPTGNRIARNLKSRIPVFVLYSNYLRVKPLIHLGNLARRNANNTLDDELYDYGNLCLLNLLGIDVSELSAMGKEADADPDNPESLDVFRAKLDERRYELNAASVKLSSEIKSVWNPNEKTGEAANLRIAADGQYLVVSVTDGDGVEVELDQRSEGFQWLVSFFIIFFAETQDKHKNAILLLDEPGVSLHGLKQRDFRETISRLSQNNQTLYTTHSPFLVGPNELDLVRVVEMTSREVGTKVHSTIMAGDSAALLPLQEALGYDLAQSLFSQSRNLILEGLTDYWYVESMAKLLAESDIIKLNEKIALVPASGASKVVYFATILYAQKLKVAALLDSDKAGDQAAKQEVLQHTLGNKSLLRTAKYADDEIKNSEIEDLLRDTLPKVAKDYFGTDISAALKRSPNRPIVKLLEAEVSGFSKYKLAKAFIKWCRDHKAVDLSENEQKKWAALFKDVNAALK